LSHFLTQNRFPLLLKMLYDPRPQQAFRRKGVRPGILSAAPVLIEPEYCSNFLI